MDYSFISIGANATDSDILNLRQTYQGVLAALDSLDKDFAGLLPNICMSFKSHRYIFLSLYSLVESCKEFAWSFMYLGENKNHNCFFYPTLRLLCEATLLFVTSLVEKPESFIFPVLYKECEYFGIKLPSPNPSGITDRERAALAAALEASLELDNRLFDEPLNDPLDDHDRFPFTNKYAELLESSNIYDSSAPLCYTQFLKNLAGDIIRLISDDYNDLSCFSLALKICGAVILLTSASGILVGLDETTSFTTREYKSEDERLKVMDEINKFTLFENLIAYTRYRALPEGWESGWLTMKEPLKKFWEEKANYINRVYDLDAWFVGDWDAERIKGNFERLRVGWFNNGKSDNDIFQFIEFTLDIYTAPEDLDPSELGFHWGNKYVNYRVLQQICDSTAKQLDSLNDLMTINSVFNELTQHYKYVDLTKMAAGILFLRASSNIAGPGKIVVGEDGGRPVKVDFILREMDFKTFFCIGVITCYTYPFMHIFKDFLPNSVIEWAGSEYASWSLVWSQIENIDAKRSLKEAWQRDIKDNRVYTKNQPYEVILGGFFKSIIISETLDRLYFLLKTSNGIVPGELKMEDFECEIIIDNPVQFYSLKECNQKPAESMIEEMDMAREAVEILVMSIFRDISVSETAKGFYLKRKEIITERITKEKSRKKKSVSRELNRYYPRKSHEIATYITSSYPNEKHKRNAHFVCGHLRRLKEGQKASDKQKDRAKNSHINLPHGFTFVRPHVRGGDEKEATNYEASKKYHCYSALELLGIRNVTQPGK